MIYIISCKQRIGAHLVISNLFPCILSFTLIPLPIETIHNFQVYLSHVFKLRDTNDDCWSLNFLKVGLQYIVHWLRPRETTS